MDAAAADELVVEPGGRDADLGELFQEGFQALSDDIGPYLLAGLGQFVVMVPVTMVAFIGGYLLLIFGGFAAMMLGGLVMGVLTALLGDPGAFLGILAMFGIPMVFYVICFAGIIGLMAGVAAPLQASMLRAVAAHQRGDKELSFTSSFDTALQDLPLVLGGAAVMVLITVVLGGFTFGIGLLAIPLVFGFVNSLIALHRRGPVAAVRIQIRHFLAHGQTHLILGLIQIAAGSMAGMVPIIGPMFATDLHVRAHRRMFGDGDEPVMS